jgi:hypothetical protein
MKQLLPCVLLLAVCGCVPATFLQPAPHTSMTLCFDHDAMQEEVWKYLCVGMPIENARRIMADSGFTVEESAGRPTFSVEELPFAEPHVTCRATAATHFLTSDEIEVVLFHQSGKLTTIRVYCRSVGA